MKEYTYPCLINSNTHIKIQLYLKFIEILLSMIKCYISSLPNSDNYIWVFIEDGVFSLALHVIRGKASKLQNFLYIYI